MWLATAGESEANVNPSILAKRPDNVIGLTERGREQAAGVSPRLLCRFVPWARARAP